MQYILEKVFHKTVTVKFCHLNVNLLPFLFSAHFVLIFTNVILFKPHNNLGSSITTMEGNWASEKCWSLAQVYLTGGLIQNSNLVLFDFKVPVFSLGLLYK